MRLLIISNMYPSIAKPYSGIFVKNQFEFLKKVDGIKTSIIHMERTFTGTFGSIMKYLNFYLRFFPHLFKKYDILHVHFFTVHFFMAYFYKILRPKTKVIVTFHGPEIYEAEGNGLIAKLLRFTSKKIDFCIAVGSNQLNVIKQIIHPKESKVLCAGIDKTKFYKIEGSKKEYDFLYIGSFYSMKGVDVVIDAIKILDDKNIRFCFVGSGEYLEKIKKLQKNYNISLFLNIDHNKLVEVYNKAKYLILPSRFDAFGLVITEAMYCGIPTIVSPTGGLKEQVTDNYNGWILKENTPHQLVSKIKEVYKQNDSEYKFFSENALNSNHDKSLEYVCNELVSIYKNLYASK